MKKTHLVLCFISVTIALILLIALYYKNKAQDNQSNIAYSVPFEEIMKDPTPDSEKNPDSVKIGFSQPLGPPVIPQKHNFGGEAEAPIFVPQEEEKLYDPNSSVVFATGDLLTIPEEERPYIRYLSLYNIPKSMRQSYAEMVSFVVNSLSTRSHPRIPEFVGASEQTLIRLDIRDYDWTTDAWENLAKKGSGPKPQPEPYFHAFIESPIVKKVKVKKQVEVIEKVPQKDQFGRTVSYVDKKVLKEVEVEENASDKREKTFAIAPWLDNVGIKTLVDSTLSVSPILRADWFIKNACLAPSYYEFLKIGKTIKDFEKLIFADEELSKKARYQFKGVVRSSIVAKNNRTLTRNSTFTGGYYWKSHDTTRSTDERNYIKFLLNEEFDATEDIGTLPNGLQAYCVADKDGNILNFADIEIAVDHFFVDPVVRTARNCMICHSDGIRPINDEIRNLTRNLNNTEKLKLLVTKEEDYRSIEDLFGRDLDERVVEDQNIFRKALARVTKLSSVQVSELLYQIYNDYDEKLLTKEIISREVGVNLNELDTYIKLSKDDLVLGMIKNPIRAVRRDQWEQSFQNFMILIMAKKQNLEHADPVPQGPLVEPDKTVIGEK